MQRQRAQAIIIQDMKVLFGVGKIGQDYLGHFFIGGGIEKDETPIQAVLREIEEETNVKGKVIFKLSEENRQNHHTFLVDIGNQKPILGYDPEEDNREFSDRALQGLVLTSLFEIDKFTDIDTRYFKLLLIECEIRDYYPEWYNQMKIIVEKNNSN